MAHTCNATAHPTVAEVHPERMVNVLLLRRRARAGVAWGLRFRRSAGSAATARWNRGADRIPVSDKCGFV